MADKSNEIAAQYKIIVAELIADRDYWKAKAEANWDCVEDVATGARLECVKCGKPRPCMCMDAS